MRYDYMSINHQLKNSLFDFLSDIAFSGYEFKDLRNLFITSYPEFSSKKYYAKIYQIIRELSSIGLILIDNRTCTYKYSSNYSRMDLLDMSKSNRNIKIHLSFESDRVDTEISKINNELFIYQCYLQRFPSLSEIIHNLTNKKESEIALLKCERTAIKNMIEAC